MWRRLLTFLSHTRFIFRCHAYFLTKKTMAARYLKSEVAVLKSMYPTESQEDILNLLPNRDWIPLCRYARSYLGLHRTRKAIGEAIKIGHEKAIKKKKKGL